MRRQNLEVCKRRLIEQIDILENIIRPLPVTPENVSLVVHLVSARALLVPQNPVKKIRKKR